MSGDVDLVFHFSEDPAIRRFEPHVPPTNPTQPPSVWAIDAEHAPLYWFPRDCPRVTAWWRTPSERPDFEAAFRTSARRVHACELAWLDRVRSTTLHRYAFDAADFVPWADASGQWVSDHAVEPVAVDRVDDLLGAHATAEIDLRLVPSLWPLHDLAVDDRWDFSIVRMRNAVPRSPDPGLVAPPAQG